MNNIKVSVFEQHEQYNDEEFGVYINSHTITTTMIHDDYDPYSLFNGELIIND